MCRLVQTLSSWESWVISVKDSCAASSLLDNCAHGGVQKQLRTWGSSVLAFPFFYGQYFSLAGNIVHCVHGNRKKRLQGFRSRVEQGLLISMQKRSPPCLIRTYKKKGDIVFYSSTKDPYNGNLQRPETKRPPPPSGSAASPSTRSCSNLKTSVAAWFEMHATDCALTNPCCRRYQLCCLSAA